MAINKKFIHFKRKSTFQRELEAGNILNTSIVFIADAKLIYLNGSYFSENTLFNLSDLLSTVSGDLTDTDTSNEAIVKLYKYLKEVDSNTDSLIKILMLEVSTLEETLTNRIDNTDLLVATELGNINLKLDNIENLINITYSELKSLRDSSKLVPGRWYRITDFVTTVANLEEARSAGHPFDIIVMASDTDTLQEECHAIQHEGDEYFANCNLAAWKIWYSLDNDTTKYAWADTTNGKGVIYRMIDEWENDCPYDFKNVQFKRYWANGINVAKNEGVTDPIILQGYYGTASNTNIFTEGIDTNDYLFCFTFTRLNNILGDYKKGSVIQSNVLDESIQTEGFDIDAKDDKLNNRCRNNILKPTETVLVVDVKEYMTLTLLNNVFITVKINNPEVYQSPFDNTLGVSCVNNTFGSNIYGLLFLSNCVNNTFENDCYGNTFGNDCSDNTFGNDCSSNTFGNKCSNNTFGNKCTNNTFGFGCLKNVFVDGCTGNMFGASCVSNAFGASCIRNIFENTCGNNSFGRSCYNNTFGSGCTVNTFGNNFQYNAIGNDVRYIEIPTEKIYHTQVLNGTKGTNTNKLTIAFTPETTYSQFAGFTSSGEIKIWNPADLNVIAE